MESRADDTKLAEAPSATVEEVGTLVNRVEKQVVVGLPASESFPTTPARVVKQVTPVVEQRTDRKKRERQTKSLTSKLHSAPKVMKEEEEEVCFICFDGGSLVLCDRKCCPKAYHPSCIKRDEAFFKSTAKWVCGWHICSVCQKAAHYMCYSCPYSICKKCTKNTDYVCVRGNKGFCLMCMKTIMMIETKDAGNKEAIQVDFDDKTSWEYLFKIYWNLLKNKLSLSLDELTQAKNTRVEVIETDFKPQIREMNHSVEEVAVKQTLHDEHQLPDQSSFSAEKLSLDKRKNSDICSEWGSKELMEFVAYMKNGDTSVLSQYDVQALLMEYIIKNNLRDPKLKSQIICDLRLKLLFGKPSVGHIEMLKLLEHHYLIKEDTPKNARLVGDDHNDDSVSNRNKRQKTKALEVNLNEYAVIDAHNINLIFLRRSTVENLIDEEEKFHDKVVGSIVRIRVSCNDQKQDFYRLVRVVGTSKEAEAYKVGHRTTNIMLEVLNLDKKETLSIDATSNQVFTEEECKRLHESIKCGIVKPLTVGEIQMKAMALQALRFDDWLIAEILRLSHLRDNANEKGHKKERKECVEKLKLLRTPEVRHQKLTEIPEVHFHPKTIPNHQSEDPKMNTNHQSEDNASKNDKQKDEVSKLGINGNHTLPPRKCVKDNEATSAQGVQQNESDSSPNRSLRSRKSVKENNKTTSADRVQPKRGKGGSNSFPKQENHVSTGGFLSVVGNQSVRKPDSETPTVGPLSTIRVQPKRDGGRLNKIPKQENKVLPDGFTNVVSNQSVLSPVSKIATVGSVSTIRVLPKRDGGRSIKIPKQENQVLHDGPSSVLSPDSKTATVGSVSTIQVQPKRGGRSNRIPMQENQVLPGGSSSVVRNQSVPNPDSESAMVVGPVSTVRVQPKRGKSMSNSVPKQENHVSHGGSASVLGNQSVMSPGSVTATVGPVSRIRVQPKRGKDMSTSSPKIKKHVSSRGNQSILRPDSITATVDPVTIIEANQKSDCGVSNTFPKQENHDSSDVVNNQSMLNPNLETANVGPLSTTQQRSDVGGSNTFSKQENGSSSTVISTQSVLRPDSEIATVGPVIGTLIPTIDAQMEKLWYYRDPNRKIQGPFSMLQLQKWNTTGYFLVDMKIWSDNEQDHSVLLTDALNGEFCSAHALNKEKQSEVEQCFDLLKNVPDSSEHIVVDKNNLEQTYEDSLNQVSKHGVENLSDAGANVHLNKIPELDSPDISSKDSSLNKHLNEAPQLDSPPNIESKDASANEHPNEALLYDSPSIESKDVVVNEHPNVAPPYDSPSIESKDTGANEHPNEAPRYDSSSIESKDAGVNEHPSEAPPYDSPSIECKHAGVNEHPNEASPYNSPSIECKDAGVNEHPNKALLLDLDLNNKDCNQASSLTNQTESPENKTDLDIVNLPTSPTAKTDNNNLENQTNELDSMSIDIQAAELLRSLSGYVPDNDMTVSDSQTPANNTDDDLRIPEQKPSDKKNQSVGESDNGPCASSQVVGCVAQIQETIAGVWVGSPARDEPSCKEWDFGLVPLSSDAVGGDHVATTTPNGNRNLLLDLSSWPVGIDEPIEFNTLAEESVSDLLAEVDAMESKSCLPSPSSAMRCGDDLIDKNDCFSSIEELSPNPDAGKSDAVSSNPEIRFPSHPTEIHDHDQIRASRVSGFDPLKRSTGCETKSVGYPINIWEPGPDIHPPPSGTFVNQQQPVVNAPNHVWGAVQGSVSMGWAGPPPLPMPPPLPPPQAFGNVSWRPNIGTTPPWVDSNLSLGAYNGNGGWDNSPHRFSGSRDYGGDSGFGRGGSRSTWSKQQHGGGGGGGGGGGYSRPFPKGQRVCKFYESGHCKKGATCGYLHP